MEVEILGKLTRVNCPPGQKEALHAAANELNRRSNTKLNEYVGAHVLLKKPPFVLFVWQIQ